MPTLQIQRTALDQCTVRLNEACAELEEVRHEKAAIIGLEISVQRKIDELLREHAQLSDACRERQA